MTIAEHIHNIKQKISQTAEACQRSPAAIKLLAVSKGQPVSAIRKAFAAGVTDFGENYWQEAQAKMHVLSDLPINWHFIGPIQSNKAEHIAQNFSWVHSLNRVKIAELLARYRSAQQTPLNLCLQVNLDNEESKAGLLPQQIVKLVESVSELPNLRLRGLMAIPKPRLQEEEQYKSLVRLTRLFNQLNQDFHLCMDVLSMGMSDDLVAAIRAGSTLLRIGRAIFGERPHKDLVN